MKLYIVGINREEGTRQGTDYDCAWPMIVRSDDDATARRLAEFVIKDRNPKAYDGYASEMATKLDIAELLTDGDAEVLFTFDSRD